VKQTSADPAVKGRRHLRQGAFLGRRRPVDLEGMNHAMPNWLKAQGEVRPTRCCRREPQILAGIRGIETSASHGGRHQRLAFGGASN